MATIKSFTDISQSKTLSKILPLESADMKILPFTEREYRIVPINDISVCGREDEIYAWSLAALLEQLKAEIQLENKQILFLHINKYDDIDYEIRYTNSWTGEVFITEADNLVDACVTMIEKLHELNLL